MHNSKKKKKTLPVGCFFAVTLHKHQAEENWRRKRWVFSIGKEHSIGKISVTSNRKQKCITTKQKKNLSCCILLRGHIALPPNWRKLEKKKMGFLCKYERNKNKTTKWKTSVAGNSTENKSKNCKWGCKTRTTKTKKKETKRSKQVGEDGRDESRFQDGRRLQKKTRAIIRGATNRGESVMRKCPKN